MRFFLFFLCLVSSLLGQEQSLAIFTFKHPLVPRWDPDSIEKGITGSEEAVIYMSQKLSDLGYRVVVLGNPPENSIHSRKEANPRYIDIDADDGKFYDVAIVWRMAGSGTHFRSRARLLYLWPHDVLAEPVAKENIYAFDGVLWLSQWQRKQWMSVSLEFERFTSIYGNGVNPNQFLPIQERKNPYSCIYGSNYARGLDILLDIWPTIKRLFPKATLDIYYGWQHWGSMSKKKEAKMRKKVANLEKLGVQEHGLVSHQELNAAYAAASFWTYPCIAPETFCITALRAQLSGNIPVVLQGSALEETVRHGHFCAERDKYLLTLIQAMRQAEKISLEERKKVGEFVKQEYTWDAIAKKWKESFIAQSN